MLTFILDLSIKAPAGVGEIAGQVTNTSYVGNILVALFFLVIIAVYGFFLDPHNRLINLIGVYMGVVVVEFFPFENLFFGGLSLWLAQLLVFSITLFLAAVFLSMTHLLKVVFVKNFLKRWLESGINGFLHGAFLVSFVLSLLPVKFLTQFSPWVLNTFISEKARFWWAILPLAGLLLMRNKSKVGRPPAY
ncbi:hypothetical protein GYA54_03635 [Candidatus Kuenenbacteria bacterium]|nr:hypothetical protein [Candidatus Kuenenbacteria bacterium]